MALLGTADKEQCGAFLVSTLSSCRLTPTDALSNAQRDERVLVVWSYHLDTIIPTCRDFEEKLIKLVWDHRFGSTFNSSIALPSSNSSSVAHLNEKPVEQAETKEVVAPAEDKRVKNSKKKRRCGLGYWVTDKDDIEKTAEGPSPRPIRLFAPVYNGLGVALSICEFALPFPRRGRSFINTPH